MSVNFYEILEVPQDADTEEIKRAFRRMAKQFHPDVNEDPEADARFRLIYTAYDILQDPMKRRLYDELQSRREEYAEYEDSQSYNYVYNRKYARWEYSAAQQANTYSSMNYQEFEDSLGEKVTFHSKQIMVLIFSIFVMLGGFTGIVGGFALEMGKHQNGSRIAGYFCLGFGFVFVYLGMRTFRIVLQTWNRKEVVDNK